MNPSQYENYQEIKKHTPDDFPYNTYLCSIPLDFKSVKIHWHDEVEIIVIKRGKGIVYVNLKKYEVQTGDIVFVFSGQLHSIEQFAQESMEYENILFQTRLLKSSGSDFCGDNLILPLLSGMMNMYPIINRSCHFYPQLSAWIQGIDNLCSSRPYAYQLAVKGYLFQIMFLLLTNNRRSIHAKSDQKAFEKIKRILTYIDEHYAEAITIEEIANFCFYSPSYFMKFFKEHMGVGFIHYLNDYRLEMAAKKLLTTTDNILNVATSSGFDNLSYFNRSFKKKYGITPGQYRKNA